MYELAARALKAGKAVAFRIAAGLPVWLSQLSGALRHAI
jgi:hypothetical protein